MTTRVRFAPSPTGYLHIGGARTALFNWLYARHTGGEFVLRVEDTDAARNTQEAVDVIVNGMRWLGLDWDEGPVDGSDLKAAKGDRGPYFQSQRGEIYQKRIAELRDKGLAYDDEGAVRFRMPRDPILIPDLIVGDVERKLTDREEVQPDFVIVRSDGQPVFHLVNVIDDLEMGITHVIRGEDHLSNTAKHIALFNAFGVEPPKYGHIPLILNSNGSKMSKRDAGASMTTYMENGYVPEAVVNFLILLGWNPKDDSEIMPIAEMIQRFDLPQVNRQNAKFDFDKLNWFNYEYLRTMPITKYREMAVPALEKQGLDLSGFDAAYIEAALATCQEKIKQLPDLFAFCDFYFTDNLRMDEDHAAKHLIPENLPLVTKLKEALLALDPYSSEQIEATFRSLAADLGVKMGVMVHPVRLGCTGQKVGPSLFHLMEVLGKAKVDARLQAVMARMQ